MRHFGAIGHGNVDLASSTTRRQWDPRWWVRCQARVWFTLFAYRRL